MPVDRRDSHYGFIVAIKSGQDKSCKKKKGMAKEKSQGLARHLNLNESWRHG